MRQQESSFPKWPILYTACLVLAISSALADRLKDGYTYTNFNNARVTVTYSWSGHYLGEPDV
jgi:hypothetical protein